MPEESRVGRIHLKTLIDSEEENVILDIVWKVSCGVDIQHHLDPIHIDGHLWVESAAR